MIISRKFALLFFALTVLVALQGFIIFYHQTRLNADKEAITLLFKSMDITQKAVIGVQETMIEIHEGR